MNNSYKDNISLIKHLKSGNEEAFAYLFDLYNHQLAIYAKSLIKDKSKAEDIIQNVFLKIWQKRDTLNSTFSLKSFLFKSVYNEFIDQYRKNQPMTPLEVKHIESLGNLVSENNDDSTEKLIKIVTIAINELPLKWKQSFLLSKKEGLTNLEISKYLDVSIKTVESRISKAYSFIREHASSKTESILLLIFGK